MIHTTTIKKLFIALAFPAMAQAQTNETVTVNPGYTNQTFYSLQNGILSSVSNTDWDLGFQVSGFEAAIIINGKNNVKLYDASKSISEWSSMVPSDTAGMTTAEFFNNDAHIFAGAFNTTADTANPFDLSWGVYDFATHIVSGDSVYFIKLNNGVVKKMMIESLANAIYTFHVADLDGTNEIIRQFQKVNYTGKNFGYYSIQNDQFIDREPVKYNWDLCFQQYWSINPISYKVTGVLTNDSVQVVKAYPVNDVTTADDAGLTNSFDNNVIGYDWKTYDFNSNSFVISDSTVYFVIDRNAGKWKVVFTGFDGSTTGNYYFTKEFLGTVGIQDQAGSSLSVMGIYPNPIMGLARMVFTSTSQQNAEVSISDLNGRQVKGFTTHLSAGLNTIAIDGSIFADGLYMVAITTKDQTLRVKFVKQ